MNRWARNRKKNQKRKKEKIKKVLKKVGNMAILLKTAKDEIVIYGFND